MEISNAKTESSNWAAFQESISSVKSLSEMKRCSLLTLICHHCLLFIRHHFIRPNGEGAELEKGKLQKRKAGLITSIEGSLFLFRCFITE